MAIQLDNQYLPIWRCLDSIGPSRTVVGLKSEVEGSYGPTHPDLDVVSLRRVTGISINEHKEQGNRTLSMTTLDTQSVKKWLPQCSHKFSSHGRSRLSLLMCDQVLRNDGLRPPLSLSETHISKSLLADCILLPKVAIEKLGQEVAYAVTYPLPSNDGADVSCHSVVSEACSASWSYDSATGTTNAIVILRQTERVALRERILRTLDALKDFSNLPSIIPYILLDSMVNYAIPMMTTSDRDLLSDQVHILSGFRRKKPAEIFGSATIRTDSIFDVLKHANTVLSMSKQDFHSKLRRPQFTSDEEWSLMQLRQQSFHQLITFRQTELEQLISHAKYLCQKSEALRSAVVGLLSFNHQETNQEIAQRTKEDGTAMKTLAVLAGLYLPSTAIATIMSMPYFATDPTTTASKGGMFTMNAHLQIFFAISIPLTVLTMSAFYLWCRLENSDHPFRFWSGSIQSKVLKCPFTGRQIGGGKMV